MSRFRFWVALAPTVLAMVAAAGGCSGDDKVSGVGKAKLPEGASDAPDHEACEEGGRRVEVLDANGDGKADVKRIYDKGSGRELCRIADLDHDGKPDLYEYFDGSGTIRRREFAYDASGAISSIEIYEGGKLVRRELDTGGLRRIDTHDTYDPATGRRVKRERDSNGDGKIDQWWTYEADGRTTIAMDKNGDGQPDPESQLVLGPGGQLITEAPPPPKAAAALDGGRAEGGADVPPPPPPPPTVLYPDAGEVGGKDGGAKKTTGGKK